MVLPVRPGRGVGQESGKDSQRGERHASGADGCPIATPLRPLEALDLEAQLSFPVRVLLLTP